MGGFIFWFEELDRKDNERVGRKCANLGAMCRMGLPVPEGFAISIDLYRAFLRETKVDRQIEQVVGSFGDLRTSKVSTFDILSARIRQIIEKTEMPKWIKEEISAYYNELCEKTGTERVSVRSAGVESRPGMFETYLNVKGEEEVVEKVKKVWGSAFTGRAIAYRINMGLQLLGDELGVAVVRMVNALCSGIGFTIDPVTGDGSKVIIESNWGLGEGVVSGGENVDRFILEKETLSVVQRSIGIKRRYVVPKESGVCWEEIPKERQQVPSIRDEQLVEVARLARKLEIHFGFPQDIEWAIDADMPFPKGLFLLQTRNAKMSTKIPRTATERIVDMIARRFA